MGGTNVELVVGVEGRKHAATSMLLHVFGNPINKPKVNNAVASHVRGGFVFSDRDSIKVYTSLLKLAKTV
jgi:hypothetical protein